ncbi:MAG: hypothetical protein PHZ02_09610 [Desulfocapsaceae bacterium]|nr:hypothetical protein [Desulfocapsaceae bacterium]
MAGTPRKKIKKIKFELTPSAIAGVGVVCFCIFLWMFLLGVWTGESLLRASHSGKNEGNKIVFLNKTE